MAHDGTENLMTLLTAIVMLNRGIETHHGE